MGQSILRKRRKLVRICDMNWNPVDIPEPSNGDKEDAFPGTGLSGDRDSGIHKTPTFSRCSERSRRYVKIRATPGKGSRQNGSVTSEQGLALRAGPIGLRFQACSSEAELADRPARAEPELRGCPFTCTDRFALRWSSTSVYYADELSCYLIREATRLPYVDINKLHSKLIHLPIPAGNSRQRGNVDEATAHLQYTLSSCPLLPAIEDDVVSDTPSVNLTHPITAEEVAEELNASRLSAARPDGLKISHLQKLNASDLASLFNIWLSAGDVPVSTKRLPFTACSAAVTLNGRQKAFLLGVNGVFENASTLHACMKDAKTWSKEIYVAMLDMAKAFDSVPHKILTRAVQRKNIDQDSIDLIINMLTGTTDAEFKELKGTPVRICSGVRQGDPLSPLLFCLFIDELIDQLQASALSYDFRGSKICVLAFADDLTLLNAAKCRTLSVCRSPKTKKMFSNPAIKFSLADSTGETSVIPSLRASDTFRFLGHHFDGGIDSVTSHPPPAVPVSHSVSGWPESIIRGATKEILHSAKAETAPLNNGGICQPLSEAPDDNAPVVSNSCAVSEIKEMPPARINMRLRSRKACENIPEPPRLPKTPQTAPESHDGSQPCPGSSAAITSSPRAPNNHPASTNTQVTHVCSVCSRVFNSFPGLRLHEKRAHPATFAASSQKSVKHQWTIDHLREVKEVEEMLAANNSRSVKALAEALSRKWSEAISMDMAKYLRKKLRAVDLNSTQPTNTALTDGVNSTREGPENITEEGVSHNNGSLVVGAEIMGPERFPECDSLQTHSANADLNNPCPQHPEGLLSEQGLDRDQGGILRKHLEDGLASCNSELEGLLNFIVNKILNSGTEDRNKHVDAAISVLIEFLCDPKSHQPPPPLKKRTKEEPKTEDPKQVRANANALQA
ncbi:Retrovirus-related Pol polyprotein from type-1 retrotransposable element [Trichinella sp. T9]|nr:Retrovirus-related Pol polyprotein from type-1 retrotransposable element [Trichinella sp. T9]